MRRGFTLIELLAVMAITSVILTVLTVGMYALHHTYSTLQTEAQADMALYDFAQHLRHDAHEAARWTVEETTLSLERFDGRRAIYDFHPESARLRRRVAQGDQTERRDTFSLPRGSQIAWQAPTPDQPPVLAVVISRPVGREPKGKQPQRQVRIEAALGLHGERAP